MLAVFGVVAALTLAQQTDTTLPVQPGVRLDVNNFGGEIVVRSWNENRVRVQGTHSSRTSVDVTSGPGVMAVKTGGRRGPAQITDLALTVPRWMALSLSGVYTDVSVEGVAGAISVETVKGDVAVVGASGGLTLRSVEGEVTVRGARGRVDAHSVEGDVRISEAAGDVVAETVDGDIVLERLASASVDASTVDGDIYFNGAVRDNGRYRLVTHDGDLTVGLPEQANVVVAVATYDGDFDASFPVQITNKAKHRFQITLGTGSARLEVETFDGDIQLRRPGEMRAPERDRDPDPNPDPDEDEDRNQQ